MNIVIRPPVMNDAVELNRIRRMDGVRENTLGMFSETLQRSEDYIKNISRTDHMLVAEVDGQVVGMAGLHQNLHPRKSHTGSLGISVSTEYQGKGIGTKLMQALLDIADNWVMLTRIELTVLEGNEGAKSLYEKLGFITEGVQKMSVKRNGRYVDETMMARIKVPEQFVNFDGKL